MPPPTLHVLIEQCSIEATKKTNRGQKCAALNPGNTLCNAAATGIRVLTEILVSLARLAHPA